MRTRLLVVLAHPDDETFGCGGTIALQTQAGATVTYVCATLGEMGRNMGKPIIATRESLPTIREQELREACRILGIQDLRLLGLRDKTVEFVDPALLASQVAAIIKEVNPSLIITFYPGYGVHPDHNAIGAATVRAVASMPADQQPPVYCRAFGAKSVELGAPDVVVDITAVQDVKMAAVAAHRSQSQLMLESFEARAAQSKATREQMESMKTKEQYWQYRISEIDDAEQH